MYLSFLFFTSTLSRFCLIRNNSMLNKTIHHIHKSLLNRTILHSQLFHTSLITHSQLFPYHPYMPHYHCIPTRLCLLSTNPLIVDLISIFLKLILYQINHLSKWHFSCHTKI